MGLSGKSSNAIRRPDLQVYINEFFNGQVEAEGDMVGMISNQVLPVYNVLEKSSTYDVIPKEEWLKIPDVKRASRGGYNRNDWQYETGYYTTDERGLEEVLDDSEASDFDRRNGAGSSEFLCMDRAMSKLMLAREKEVADMIFNATNFTSHAITNEWDDATNATPIDDLKTAKLAVRAACGILPNTLIINFNVFENLKRCAQIIDLLKYDFGSQGISFMRLSAQQLAKVLGIPNVLIAGAQYDSAAGGQSASVTDIWSNEYAMLTRIEAGSDITKLQLGRTFLWTDDSAAMPVTEQYREEKVRSEVYRVRYYGQPNLLASRNTSGTIVSNLSQAVSYLFSNVTT